VAPEVTLPGVGTLPTYGLFYALSYLAIIATVSLFAWRRGLPVTPVLWIGVWIGVGETVVSRGALWLLGTPPTLESGGAVQFGIIGALIGGFTYAHFAKIPRGPYFDIVILGTPVGLLIGRFGCWFGGCCFGAPFDGPWAVTYTDPLAHTHGGVPLQVGLHPAPLYDALATGIIGVVLLLWARRKQAFHGQLFVLFVVLACIARLVLEPFRGDIRGDTGLGLTVTQLFALITLFASPLIYLLVRRLSQGSPDPAKREEQAG